MIPCKKSSCTPRRTIPSSQIKISEIKAYRVSFKITFLPADHSQEDLPPPPDIRKSLFRRPAVGHVDPLRGHAGRPFLQQDFGNIGQPAVCIYERPPKPPTFWNSYSRTLILDTIMKLSGTIGVTQKTMTLDTHVCLILLQTLNPQERWGTHKKRWPFQPRPFPDVIGLVCCSY